MRRLIIGCGYLGQRVATRWLDSGGTVDVLTRSAMHAADFRAQGLNPVIGDVLDPMTLEQLPEVDTVFWAVGWDRASGRSMQDVYVSGLENVLHRMSSRCQRVIAISSTSVYGQNNGEWVDERSVCHPAQPNGQTCLDAECLLRSQAGTPTDRSDRSGQMLETNVIRLSGIYGPGRLLSRVAALKTGEPLGGNPDAWLNLIQVDDAADAVVKCEQLEGIPGTLLVSDDEPLRRREYYSILAELVGAPGPRFLNEGRDSEDAPPELNKRCRNELAKLALGWAPKYKTCRDGLLHAVQSSG